MTGQGILDALTASKDNVGDLVTVLQPYLPALARAGDDVYDGFVAHLGNKNWEAIDTLMYARMTVEERRKLDDEVYQGLRAAAVARFNRIQLSKELAFKLALRILLMGIGTV